MKNGSKASSPNPDWTRDELILALDLYFRLNSEQTSPANPQIIELSQTLNSLPIHPRASQYQKFRNANAVSMKLSNFLRFDPTYKGKGLPRGNKLEEAVWNEFSSDLTRLHQIAVAIVQSSSLVSPPKDKLEIIEDKQEEFAEGRILTQLHKRRERNPALVDKKKKLVFQKTGALICEVCGFDFYQTYGLLGRGFVECHHNKPISTLSQEHTSKISDLSVVCANCHRMLHRIRPWKSPNELKALMREMGTQHV